MSIAVPVAPSRRIDVFDGLRGVAIILVVMSHGWTLWPTTEIQQNPLLRALFTCGDFAVSIFFVVGFFLATRGMLRIASGSAGLRPGIALLRRWIRLSGQMYTLLVVVIVVTVLDTTDTYPDTATRTSVVRAATYTWNWYVENNAIEARPDLGHLWYLSVDLQIFVLVLLLVWLLRRRPGWLVCALATMFVSMLLWRTHVYQTNGEFSALLRTWARGDAPVGGALAAAAIPYLGRLTRWARPLCVVGLVSLLPLMYYTAPTDGYFHLPGVLLDLALMAIVVACTLATPPRPVTAVLGLGVLTFLGRKSLSIYLWHYPVFWFVSRHTFDWSWETRLLLALAITAAASWISDLLVERRIQRILASPEWRQTDEGLSPYLAAQARRRGAEVARKVRRTRRPSEETLPDGELPDVEPTSPGDRGAPI